MKQLFLFFLITPIYVFSQCDERYQDPIFSEVSVSTVEYTNVYDWSTTDTGLDMDIYQPVGDTFSLRPLIIFAHGGTYISGNKDNPTMVTLCESFAKRGYVTASIQYRLTSMATLLSPNASEILTQTVFNSISDMKAAIRYFRKDIYENNNTYRVDQSLIFVGGYSAGAVTATHLALMDVNDVPSNLQSFVDASGGIDGNSGNEGYSSEVSGAVNIAGAIHDLSFIDSQDQAVVSIHALDDNTVSYDCANALNNANLPVLCGSGEIHQKLDEVSVYNDLYSISSGGHGAPLVNLETVGIPFVVDFLYPIVCQNTGLTKNSEQALAVFPNPAISSINFQSKQVFDKLVLCDAVGRIVLELNKPVLTHKLNLSGLKNGMYYLSIFDNKGSCIGRQIFQKIKP